MASRRTAVIVTRLPFAFVVAVGLESYPLSASESSAPQKRGMKNIKVARRLKTSARTRVCPTPSCSVHAKSNESGNPRYKTYRLEFIHHISDFRQRVRDPPVLLIDWDNVKRSQADENVPQFYGRSFKSQPVVLRR